MVIHPESKELLALLLIGTEILRASMLVLCLVENKS